ncbi:MAG: hypothetical protein C4293_10910, partial [Nitrospiraceae bacterium]
MNSIRNCLLMSILVITCAASWVFAGENRTGFLMVVPDRRFLGNQEIQAAFQEFKKSYALAAMALVGRDYNGVGTEYSAY